MRRRNLIQQGYRYVQETADGMSHAKILQALIESEVRLAGFQEEGSAEGKHLLIQVIGERWQLDHFWQCLSQS